MLYEVITVDSQVFADGLEVLNSCGALPFGISEDTQLNENLRLKYRYLDLRRSNMMKNMMKRHTMLNSIRKYMDEKGFLEIDTPILTKSTPEGARDFLVPSRTNGGQFYVV